MSRSCYGPIFEFGPHFSRTACSLGEGICFAPIITNTHKVSFCFLNPLTPNDLYMSRTAPLTSKRCILYIY